MKELWTVSPGHDIPTITLVIRRILKELLKNYPFEYIDLSKVNLRVIQFDLVQKARLFNDIIYAIYQF